MQLVHGRFHHVADQAASGYDLITSKNTLKNGYLHAECPAPLERLSDLGVSDAAFATALCRALKPGGVFVIYNICPAPSKPGEPYQHWAATVANTT